MTAWQQCCWGAAAPTLINSTCVNTHPEPCVFVLFALCPCWHPLLLSSAESSAWERIDEQLRTLGDVSLLYLAAWGSIIGGVRGNC